MSHTRRTIQGRDLRHHLHPHVSVQSQSWGLQRLQTSLRPQNFWVTELWLHVFFLIALPVLLFKLTGKSISSLVSLVCPQIPWACDRCIFSSPWGLPLAGHLHMGKSQNFSRFQTPHLQREVTGAFYYSARLIKVPPEQNRRCDSR